MKVSIKANGDDTEGEYTKQDTLIEMMILFGEVLKKVMLDVDDSKKDVVIAMLMEQIQEYVED